MNIKNKISKIDKEILSIIRVLSREAKNSKVNAYLVGGFVRDMLLKRENLDLDVVIESDAIEFAKKISKKLKGELVLHKKFGTATVYFSENKCIDFATARSERYPYSGALPVVSRGSINSDLFRRDFTINAMAVCISKERFGELVDNFKGLEDLKKRKVRILHKYSFIDDPTRILRAIRFEQRFKFKIETETLGLIKSAVKKGVMDNVKSPRMFEEFKKLLEEDNPDKNIKRLGNLAGLSSINDNLSLSIVNFKLIKDLQKSVLWFYKDFSDKQSIIRWLPFFQALVYKMPHHVRDDIAEEFNLIKEARRSLTEMKDLPVIKNRLSRKKLAPHQVYSILKPFSYETIIFSHAENKNKLVKGRIKDFLSKYDSIKLNLKGSDLKCIGITSGENMGRIMQALLYEKIDGKLTTLSDERKAALSLKNEWS